jgi:integrase
MIYPRRGVYHCDFTVNGQRVRQTLETTDRREAIQRERDLIARAKEGKLASGMTAELSRLQFEAALDRYLAELSVVREDGGKDPRKTWEGRLTERLRPFFAGKRLKQISSDDIREYQAHRLTQGRHKNTINHEVKALLRLLKRAKLASRVRDDVKLLRVKREFDPERMLTEVEKQRLFETAASNDDWQIAYCAALLTANTSMRPVEIKRLRWRDLDPVQRLIVIRKSKTDEGSRMIPLNDDAWSAIVALKERADALGTAEPQHYILPRMFPTIDGSRPMGSSGWRSAWRSLREATAKGDEEKGKSAMPKLTGFRYYDLRHQCVTEMLEAGIPEGVIREIAGHIDPAMTRHYCHPCLAARRAAVNVLSTVRPSQNQAQFQGVTSQTPPQSSFKRVLESRKFLNDMVRLAGFEAATCRSGGNRSIHLSYKRTRGRV